MVKKEYGCYHVSRKDGKYMVFFLEMDGKVREVDGNKRYGDYRTAWRRADQLNHPIKHAIRKTGEAIADGDGYKLIVRKTPEGYVLSFLIGDGPATEKEPFCSVIEVENWLRPHGHSKPHLDWRPKR